VVHVALGFLGAQRVQRLRVAGRAQRAMVSTWVSPRVNRPSRARAGRMPTSAPDGADLGPSRPSGRTPFVQDALAHGLLLRSAKAFLTSRRLRIMGLAKLLQDLGFQGIGGRLLLLGHGPARAKISATRCRSSSRHAGGDRLVDGTVMRRHTSNLGLPISARICFCRAMTGCMASCPTAGPPASCLRALVSARLDHQDGVGGAGHAQVEGAGSICGTVGLMTNSSSMKPTRTAPMGPSQGTSEIMRAARGADDGQDVQVEFWVGARAVTMTWTSLRIVLREERPQRAVDEAGREDGLVAGAALAALKKLPGMRPAAYRRSSKSTLSGKKSMPFARIRQIVSTRP
jgi:hypothetical protein